MNLLRPDDIQLEALHDMKKGEWGWFKVRGVAVPRKEIRAFAEVMEQRLRDNDHKGSWKDCLLDYLVMRLVEEMGELMSCLLDSDKAKDIRIVDEAADAANFLMMICDNLGLLTDKTEGVTIKP